MKLYLMHSSCAVIILFNAEVIILLNSAFSVIHSFKKLVFRLSAFYVFCFFCFELDITLVNFLYNICVVIVYIDTKCSVILFLPKSLKDSFLFSLDINYLIKQKLRQKKHASKEALSFLKTFNLKRKV